MSCNLFSLKLFSIYIKTMEHKETQINELYPILPKWECGTSPSAPPLDEGQSYRLHKINEIQSVLEDEREKRHNLSKK